MPEVSGPAEPLVSVCIPVYNRAELVRVAIASAVAQNFASMEIVVVDNCSDDLTWDVVNSFHDRRIRAYRNPVNIGALANFNRCLALAAGRYVRFLCSDDALTPATIRREVQYMESCADLALLSGSAQVYRGAEPWCRTGDHLRPGIYPAGDATIVNLIWVLAAYGYNPLNFPSGILIRRSAALRAGKFEAAPLGSLDFDFWLRVLQFGALGIISDETCTVDAGSGTWGDTLQESGDFMLGQYRVFERWEGLFDAPTKREIVAHLGARCLWLVARQIARRRFRSAAAYWSLPIPYGVGRFAMAWALALHIAYRARRRFGVRRSKQDPADWPERPAIPNPAPPESSRAYV